MFGSMLRSAIAKPWLLPGGVSAYLVMILSRSGC
jgi:hypothetical protein